MRAVVSEDEKVKHIKEIYNAFGDTPAENNLKLGLI